MENIFITNIRVHKVNNLTNFDILLSSSERKHLILTGANGIGKTRLLEALRDNMISAQQEAASKEEEASQLFEEYPKSGNSLSLSYSNDISRLPDVPVLYFPASRQALIAPKRAEGSSFENLSLLDFMLSISDKGEDLYGQCFLGLQGFLREIYDVPKLELMLHNYVFHICVPGKKPLAIHQISDCYASLLNIYMTIALRSVLLTGTVRHELPAIVLVDEVEAHLHFSLQRRILSILTSTFPGIQFIVTTNAPFIITALKNAIVFDLGKNRILERATFYSYDYIVDSYFCTIRQHQAFAKCLAHFKDLIHNENLSDKESVELIALMKILEAMTPANYELYSEYNELMRSAGFINRRQNVQESFDISQYSLY